MSLDDADNDPVVLLSYIATALNAVEPVDRRVFRGVAAGGDALWATAVPRLGSVIASLEAPVVIVLDDVHALTDSSALDVVDALALHVPTGSLLVFAGRGEAALSLARYRARGELLEIGPADLALTDSQAGALLADSGVDVSDVEAHALNERAEGWAAGLYLAALALKAPQGPTGPDQFAGDDRFVTEYLRVEQLAHLKPKEVEFLTRTAVLDRMTGPFCDAVLGRTDSAKMLSALEQANMFVVALDHHGGWFRYHHLFRDMLRAELERREPELVSELHRRAAAWCVENHFATGRSTTVRRPGTSTRWPSWWRRTRSRSTATGASPPSSAGWRRSTSELLSRYPAVAVFGAWVSGLRGRPTRPIAGRSPSRARTTTARCPMEVLRLRPWAALLRARLCEHGIDRMRADAEIAIEELSPQSLWMPIALLMRGVGALLAGETEAGSPDAGAGRRGRGRRWCDVRRRGCPLRARVARARARRPRRGGVGARARAQLRQRHGAGRVRRRGDPYAAEARLALARGQGARAREALVVAQRLRPMITRALSWFGVQTTLELAQAHLTLNDAEGARTLCLEADDLLHRNPDWECSCPGPSSCASSSPRSRTSPPGWASTLTTAELRLLPLLTTHLTFREIAERLFVSRNTVKTQAISVYRKLDATSRSEAIERAIELGLVDEAVAARPVDFTRTG